MESATWIALTHLVWKARGTRTAVTSNPARQRLIGGDGDEETAGDGVEGLGVEPWPNTNRVE